MHKSCQKLTKIESADCFALWKSSNAFSDDILLTPLLKSFFKSILVKFHLFEQIFPKFAQSNINSIRNKFNSLINIINNNTGILMISETKLDPSFTTGQFHIHGFSERAW